MTNIAQIQNGEGKRARPGRSNGLTPLTLLCILLSLLCAPCVFAAPAESELQIMARMLSFLNKPLTGTVRVGIVYSTEGSPSFREATDLEQLMGSGFKSSNVTLKPVRLSLKEAARANVDLFILMNGVDREIPEGSVATLARKVPCVTLDLDQVRKGDCAIGIQTSPRIEILVNREAAAHSGVEFAGAFRMLITEF